MRSFDLDGVVTAGCMPVVGDIIVTGRRDKYAVETKKQLAGLGVPDGVAVYLRPSGADDDRVSAGEWKALVCQFAGVDEHWEDDPLQAEIIRRHDPHVHIVLVKGGGVFD